MSEISIFKTILHEFPYALAGSILVGMLCAYLGVYVVSRKIVFVGATLTQSAIAGIAFAHLPFIAINPLYGSILFTIIIVIMLGPLLNNARIPRDSILGIIFVASIAFRILMIQKSPAAEVAEIDAILKGDILFITKSQLYSLIILFVSIMTLYLLLYKEMTFMSIDSEMASTQGFRSTFWELLFYLTIGITISVATRVVGDVFVFSFLVIPAVTAMLISKKVVHIYIIAVGLGIITPFIGIYSAFIFDFPAGPVTVATGFAILLIALAYSKISN